jgi:HrpA-like RNA helicase
MNKNIGILDPKGLKPNPLTGEKYSKKYKELAKIWCNLPAYERSDEIINKIKDNQVILTIFETGAGKTVLNPKFALHSYKYDAKIAITLPKRIIAKSAAEFAAVTLDVEIGQEVGYQYKGASVKSDKTKLLYATDGTIVARLLKDPELKDFNCVIIDESHERKVQIDFLLYLLRETLKLRPEFKIIIMSATIDSKLFANYFRDFKYAQIDVPGARTFPIESRFLEKKIDYNKVLTKGYDILIDILETDDMSDLKVAHDVIFFVTSSNEAFNLCQILNNHLELEKKNKCKITCKGDVFCVEVYSGMNPDKQTLAQDKESYKQNKYNRKVVIATNVAESSLTIDGVRYVIDTGYELSGTYDPIIRARKLDRKLITQAQSKQRMGRAGRTEPGICYHLYRKEDFESQMSKFPEPDIRTSDITMECLKLLNNENIQTVDKLISILSDFIEPPRENYIRAAVDILAELGALKDNKITDYGKLLNQLPENDIFLANTLIFGKLYNCSREVLKINSLINVTRGNMSALYNLPGRDNKEKEKKFQTAKRKTAHKYGDHLTLLKIYEDLEEQFKKDNKDKLYEWAYKNFYKINTLLKAPNEYKKAKGKLYQIARIDSEKLDLKYFEEIKNLEIDERVLACYIMGFQLNTAIRENNVYNTRFNRNDIKIARISTLSDKKPKNVIYNELFISMNNPQLTIVSEIPNKIMDILK